MNETPELTQKDWEFIHGCVLSDMDTVKLIYKSLQEGTSEEMGFLKIHNDKEKEEAEIRCLSFIGICQPILKKIEPFLNQEGAS